MVCHVRSVEDEDDEDDDDDEDDEDDEDEDEDEDDCADLWGVADGWKCAMGKGNRGRVFVLLGQ
jgi:hypothetical protein